MQQEKIKQAVDHMEQLELEEAKSVLEAILADSPNNIEAVDNYTDLLE
jgi:hypothetical protein